MNGHEEQELVSREVRCISNAGRAPATVELNVYFEDRDPAGPFRVEVRLRRTLHLRFNDLTDPGPLSRNTACASAIRSNAQVVQHSRLDFARSHPALLSAIAFPIPS